MTITYWLVSAPQAVSSQVGLKQKISDPNLSSTSTLNFPSLRVGNLDSLLSLSDDLVKFDSSCEQVVSKVVRQLDDLAPKKGDAPFELPEVSRPNGERVAVPVYLSVFQWDESQYPLNKTLREITEIIHEKCVHIDDEIKQKSSEFAALRTNLAQIARKESGSLAVRGLEDIVAPEDFVDSEYLTTLFVVVPKHAEKEWLSTYETLGNIEFIVPGSSKRIAEDGENFLFTVVLFKKFVHDFSNECRTRRFTVREMSTGTERVSGKAEKERLETEIETRKRELLRLCTQDFSETFTAWVHLKVVKLFVESILRYGLPPQFDAFFLKPVKKNERKLRDVLSTLLGDLSHSGAFSSTADETHAGMEYYPYVYVPLNL